jgi:hypothetical protein
MKYYEIRFNFNREVTANSVIFNAIEVGETIIQVLNKQLKGEICRVGSTHIITTATIIKSNRLLTTNEEIYIKNLSKHLSIRIVEDLS